MFSAILRSFIVIILLFFCFTIKANATDVTISATSIPGIQPLGLPAARSLTGISVTNNSTDITCTSCFLPAYVGLSGFTLNLGGVNYSDVTITSTSGATLGTAYAGSTGTTTGTFYSYILIRWYATIAFQPKDASYVIQPGTVDTQQYFRQYAASVIGGTAQIETMVIPATTDATLGQRARWVMKMYLPNGSPLNVVICPTQVTQWAIQPYTPTTLPAICGYNYPPAIVPPNNESYTKPQIDYRFPSCTTGRSVYYPANGNRQSCLTFGTGLQLLNGTLSVTGGGGGGYSQIMKDGTALTTRGILNFTGTGLTAVDNATLQSTDIGLNPGLNALAANTSNGLWARTGTGTGAARSLIAPTSGFTITNPDGVAGNPTFALSGNLAGLDGLSGTGLATKIGASSWIERTLSAATSDVTVTNGSGVAGNPTIGLAANVARLDTAQAWTGSQTFNAGGFNPGPAASDPSSPTAGVLYFNTATGLPKYYNGTSWVSIQGISGNIAFLDVAQSWTAKQTFNAGNLNIGTALTAPATPATGDVYFNNTTSKTPAFYDGTAWRSSPIVLYSAYPNLTLTTTATAVTVIPDNRLDVIGSAIKITMVGTYQTTASADVGVTLSINGTAFNHFTVNGASIGTGTWTYTGQITRYNATNMISLGGFNMANATFFNFSLSTIRNSNDFAMATGTQTIQASSLVTNVVITLKSAHIVYYPAP